jgi:hypothetical protein
MTLGPATEIQTFDRLTLRGRRWHFRIVDCGNNEILAASETYNSKQARDRTATRLAYAMGCAVVPGKVR